MPLFKRLKEKNLVEDKKEYQELIYTRQISVDNKIIDHPKHHLDPYKKYKLRIGILEIEV